MRSLNTHCLLSLALIMTIAGSGLSADEPAIAAQRHEESALQAIKWLVKTTHGPAWDETDTRMANVVAKKRVVESLTALLLLMYDDVDEFNEMRGEMLAEAERRIGKPSLASIGFATWIDGFSGLYLTELSLREGKAHGSLESVARGFIERQNPEGGWSHTGANLVDFYPTTLISASNLGLLSLGAARHFQLGVVDSFEYQEAVEEALQLYRDVQAASGALPYGGRPYRKGFESGRTAWALLGLAALEECDSPLFQRAAAYVQRNVANVPFGHASPAMHIGLGALSLRMLGGETWAEFEEEVLAKLRDYQTDEGWFRDVAGVSPDSMKLVGDGPQEAAYRTALYALALSADRSRIVRTLAEKVHSARPVTTHTGETVERKPRAQLAVPGALKIAVHGNHAAALASDGGLYPINLRTHRVLKKIDIRLTRKTRPLAELFLHGTDLLVVVMPEDNAQMPASLRNAMDIASSQDFSKCELRCFDILTGKEIWHAAAPAFIRAAFFSPTSFNTIQHNGLLVKYNLSDGLVVAEVPTVQAFVNLDCVLLEDGRVVSAGESRLSLLDPRGGPIWTTRTRGARGVTRPAFGALATAGKHLYAGSSDGLVQCLDVEDGALLWKAELNAAVMQLLVSSRYEGMAIAACGDGRMHGIRAGQVVWSLDVNRGRETVVGNQVSRPFSARLVDAGVLIDNPAARQLQLVDPATGRFESHIPCRGAWSAHGSNAVVLSDGIAQIFETAAPRDDR